MKLSQTEIEVNTSPPSDSYLNFAISCRRDLSYINKAVNKGFLNWGTIYGLHVVILDDLAEAFKEKCRAMDAHRREIKKAKIPRMRD